MIGRFVLGAVLATVGAGGIGPGGPEAARGQDVVPGRGPLGGASPRVAAARQIATILREGVEVDADQLIAGLPAASELASRRSEIAEQMMEFALVKFVEPPSPTAERGTFHAAIMDYLEWSSRRLDATLERAGSDDDRRKAMAGEVAKLRRLEEVYRELANAEGVAISPQNLLELEFERVELESRLVRLVGGGER
ncbi:hypothetical protein [Tautonia sociabilis]|uniref:Uncharacterized protein n=1 Tax=Tautonia sociabilis TaxID=2080755 RepID=A0A432MN31_9BACT|nr:hypothetical protein [Tautonia sociabilis]RUL88710.1 hypothetical protein TsocGM_06125 [Tautonia sociabilis]